MDNQGPYNGPPSNKKLQQTQAKVDEVIFAFNFKVISRNKTFCLDNYSFRLF